MSLGEYLGAGSGTTKLLLHLNGNSTDSSGNSNNGTDTAITYSQANGKFGQGAGFNGTTSKIITTTTGFPTGAGARTIIGWIYKTTTAVDVFCGNLPVSGSSKSYFGSFINNTRIWGWAGGVNGNTSTDWDTGIDITLNTWQMIAITYDGTSMKISLNAGNQASANKTINTLNYDSGFWIGVNNDGPANFWHGAIDEVLIENRAWSASEVKKYYTMTKGRFGII